uniref:Serine/arginine-rich splicing factor 7 n=1 Tax=Ciona savignyi TaxID=51511 RepID=H2Z4P4_CIOSA
MSRSSFRASSDRKVYVGNLGSNASREELEEEFGYYGRLDSVWVARNPPGFAYVLFEDARDAKDAVRALDGKVICDRKVRVDISNSRSTGRPMRRGPPSFDRFGGGRSFRSDMRCYNCSETGHFARDCPRSRGVGRRRRSRTYSRSRSRSRSYSRSRSRSPKRKRSRRTRSRSGLVSLPKWLKNHQGKSRSKSADQSQNHGDSRSRSRSRSPRKSRSRSRSRSPVNGIEDRNPRHSKSPNAAD